MSAYVHTCNMYTSIHVSCVDMHACRYDSACVCTCVYECICVCLYICEGQGCCGGRNMVWRSRKVTVGMQEDTPSYRPAGRWAMGQASWQGCMYLGLQECFSEA